MFEGLRAAVSFLWRWSLLLTVPVACLFMLWAFRTGTKFMDLGVRFQSLNESMSLHRIGGFEAMGLARDVELVFRPRQRARPPGLRQIEMYVADSAEAQLNSRLPHSGREYVKATLQYPDGSLGEVKLRYRGDHFWHWGAKKKSLRIKTKKTQLFERMRSINLSAPKTADQIVEQLSNELALRMDLIAPRSELVDLWVNGERRGVHLLVEQLEEMVIRTNGRMPGDIFSGDIVRRNQYEGIPARVFESAGFWEKQAINNHFPDEENANLERLVEAISSPPSRERTERLRDLVDLPAFARFNAFRTLCQTFHFDDSHNQRLYYDPWRNHFVPVVWDPLGWHRDSRPTKTRPPKLDVITSALDLALFQDPEFLALRQEALERWFTEGHQAAFMERAEELRQQIDPSLDVDPGLCRMLTFLTPTEVRREIDKVFRDMGTISSAIERGYLSKPELRYSAAPSVPGALRLEVHGRRAIMGVELDFEQPFDAGAPRAWVSYLDAAGNAQRTEISAHVTARGQRLLVSAPFVSQILPEATGQPRYRDRFVTKIKGAVFDLTFDEASVDGNRLARVSALDLEGKASPAERVRFIAPTPLANVHSPMTPAPLRNVVQWSGTMEFQGVTTVTDDVMIAEGTVLSMRPDASIILEGKVLARGTATNPIRIVAAESDGASVLPFGTFALRGKGANGSILSFVEMSHGSGLKTTRAEYSAGLSIHDVDQVIVEDCTFSDSQVVDDMVHAVYSTVEFRRCRFVRSLMDALDIDISEALVEDCTFVESGNDALDLMTSTVAVVNCSMLRSGDKGASVGEDTRAFFVNCTMERCLIGIQIKDRSQATLANCAVLGNNLGIDAYKKNWRYDSGGFAWVYNSVVEDNQTSFGADKVSSIQVHDTFIAERPELGPKEARRILFDHWSDKGTSSEGAYRGPFRFPDDSASLPVFLAPFWSHAVPTRRGPAAPGATGLSGADR